MLRGGVGGAASLLRSPGGFDYFVHLLSSGLWNIPHQLPGQYFRVDLRTNDDKAVTNDCNDDNNANDNPRNGLTKSFYESIVRTFYEVLRYGLTKLFNNIVNPFRGLLFSANGVSALRPKF